ncbi:hypothetical protein QBC47DRAFT_360209 [Echria macrotheca]|uniref:Uncharacterized protein n=1 Tax=Echria macrotheca TaxID=438768 RepID=A0AAJ0BFZ4_9PEZI|nr:hypothetical protein QBC47DRAFT_360209 [Echria macrotheca]
MAPFSSLVVVLLAVAMKSNLVHGQSEKGSSWCDAANWMPDYSVYHFMNATLDNYAQVDNKVPTFTLNFTEGHGTPFSVACDGVNDPLVSWSGEGRCNDIDHWDTCVRRCQRYTGEPPPNIRAETTCNRGGCNLDLYWNCSDPSYSKITQFVNLASKNSFRRPWVSDNHDWISGNFKTYKSGMKILFAARYAPEIPDPDCVAATPNAWTVTFFDYQAIHTNWSQEVIDNNGFIGGMFGQVPNFDPNEDNLQQVDWRVTLTNPAIKNFTLGCRVYHTPSTYDNSMTPSVGRLEWTTKPPLPPGPLPKAYKPGDLYWSSCTHSYDGPDTQGFPSTVTGSVAFDMTTNTLWFNQTWACGGDKSTAPSLIFASGQGPIPAACTTRPPLNIWAAQQSRGLPGSNTWVVECTAQDTSVVDMNVVSPRPAAESEAVDIYKWW